MDYGCATYTSVRQTNLKLLDVVHNVVIRYATGAFCTRPIVSLYWDAGLTSLQFRRHKLLLSYASKIRPLPTHLNHTAFTENRRVDLV